MTRVKVYGFGGVRGLGFRVFVFRRVGVAGWTRALQALEDSQVGPRIPDNPHKNPTNPRRIQLKTVIKGHGRVV